MAIMLKHTLDRGRDARYITLIHNLNGTNRYFRKLINLYFNQ